MPTATSSTSLPAYASAVPSGVWALAKLVGRPFAGIPLALRDGVYRPIFLFFLCIGLSAGLWLNFVGVWLAQGLGATPTQVGWFFSAGFLAAALGNFTMPLLADRVGSRKGVTLGLVVIGSPCFVAIAFANGYWMALLAILPLWFGAALFSLMLGVAGDVARERVRLAAPDKAGTAIAALQTAQALGAAASPLLGGWLYEQTGALRPAVLLAILPNLAGAWILWRYVHDPRTTREERVAAAGRRVVGLATLRSMGWPLLLFLAVTVWHKVGDSRGPFEPLYAAEALGASKAQVGLLVTAITCFQLLLMPVMGPLTDRWGAGAMTTVGIVCFAMHGFLMSATSAFWQQLAITPITAAGAAIGLTAPLVYAQRLAPKHASAATGWVNACVFLGFTGGVPLAGRVVELAGYRGLFVFSASVTLSAAVLVGALVALVAARRRKSS